MLYLTADLHFNHSFCAKQRGYSNIESMHEAMVANWNRTVDQKDSVYVLGDVAFFADDKIVDMIDSLHGKKFLIPGNHDTSKEQKRLSRVFTILSRLEVLKARTVRHLTEGICSFPLTLCHYPLLCGPTERMAYGHLHGNTHRIASGNIPENRNAIDVGWDVFGQPVSPLSIPAWGYGI